MSKPVQVLVLGKGWKEAWYQLTQEERDDLWAKAVEIGKRAGSNWTMLCDSRWANEAVYDWAVIEYPSMAALQTAMSELEAIGWWRFFSAETILGAKRDVVPW